ncbi:TPA: tryptophan synthase subunit alpha [bacterium]|nr:tryptophan synthase subunit alpha [bacterium]
MNRLKTQFGEFCERGEACFIPFITVGYPDLETSCDLVLEFERRGAGVVELGVPFSDPIADGVVIQRASEASLKKGTTLVDVLDLVRNLRSKSSIPLVLLTYYNPVYKYGIRRFVENAVEAGVDGVIVPDLPPEEAGVLKREAEGRLNTIFLLAPTSTEERIRLIVQFSTGFVYYVSLTGITGIRERLASAILPHIEKIRRFTNLPIGVGFGISNPEQAAEVASFADGVIVGSAIVDLISKNEGDSELVHKVGEFASSLIAGMKQGVRKEEMNRA